MTVRALMGAVFGALIAFQAWAIDEGIDYTALPKPQPTETGDKIEVLEVFMYTCPHCYHLEPTLEKWLETKPENVEFRRMPAVFGANQIPFVRAFYAAEVLGKGEQFDLPLFRALHVEKRQISDEDSLVAFAEEQGIDGDAFRNAYNSFFVDTELRRAQEMGKRYGIDGVPTIIVNGKYRTSPSQTGSMAKLIEVIDYLIAVESGKAPADDHGANRATPDDERPPRP